MNYRAIKDAMFKETMRQFKEQKKNHVMDVLELPRESDINIEDPRIIAEYEEALEKKSREPLGDLPF